MKKLLLIPLLIGVLFLSACGNTGKSGEKPAVDLKSMKAEEIANTLKDAGFPIDKMIVYTEETDKNNILGRPNGYTSKINAADTRLEQYDDSNPAGLSVEVFPNVDDAKSRQDYINSLGAKASIFNEYNYLAGGVLLRLNTELTPDQAAVYEQALKDMAAGKLPTFK